jgi:hypothetical protein
VLLRVYKGTQEKKHISVFQSILSSKSTRKYMAFSTSTSKESSIVKTVEDEKFVQIYTPDETAVQLSDNRRSIKNLKPMLHAGAIGIHSYLSGIHRIRARINRGYPFFGIRSRSIPLEPRENTSGSYSLTDSTYGWEKHGHYTDGYISIITPWNDGNIVDHVWAITLNCDGHRISIIDEDTKDQEELEVDVSKAPLPWCLFVGLPRTLGSISLI